MMTPLVTILLHWEEKTLPFRFDPGVPIPAIGEALFAEYRDAEDRLVTTHFRVVDRSFLFRDADSTAGVPDVQACVVKLDVQPLATWQVVA